MKDKIRMTILSIVLAVLLFVPVQAETPVLVDITSASIGEIQSYVDQGLINYETITRVYLERIELYQAQYESIITVNPNAIEEAKALDKIYQDQGRLSELHGIPIIAKDNIDVKGMPTTAGAKGLLNNMPKEDATVVKRLRDQGALFIAKANMDEFSFNATKSESMFGLVRNAYDLNTSAYGSSGGTASAVASSLAVVGLGTDTGVSIRVPAAANNLYGLRPSYDLIDTDGVIKFEFLRDTVGPMAKYPKDAELVYQYMSNEDYIKFNELETLRVGVYRTQYHRAPKFIKELMDEKIQILKDHGIEVIDVPGPTLSYRFDSGNFCYDFNEYIIGTEGPVQSMQDLANTGEYSQGISGYLGAYCYTPYTKTQAFKSYLDRRTQDIKRTETYFVTHNIDVVLYPTLGERLQGLNTKSENELATYSDRIAPQTGFPAITVPIGFDEGLPYGMEFLGQAKEDNKLLALAKLLDEKHPTYFLPDISPSVHTPFDKLETLQTIINSKHKEEEYITVQNEIQDFLDNFNSSVGQEDKANALIEKYESVEAYLIKQEALRLQKEEALRLKKELEHRKMLFYSGLALFLIALTAYLVSKRKNKKK